MNSSAVPAEVPPAGPGSRSPWSTLLARKNAIIAVLALLAIVAHLLLRFAV